MVIIGNKDVSVFVVMLMPGAMPVLFVRKVYH
jgi:hypothetical protein